MIYRFEHEASLPADQYDAAVREYASDTVDPTVLLEISPRVNVWNRNFLQGAGSIALVSASPDIFAGIWHTGDEAAASANFAYPDMLEWIGLPDSVDCPPMSYDRHLVAGRRIEGEKFAVTSLFRAPKGARRGRPASEAARAKQEQLEIDMRGLVDYRLPMVNQFNYREIRRIATKLRILREPSWPRR